MKTDGPAWPLSRRRGGRNADFTQVGWRGQSDRLNFDSRGAQEARMPQTVPRADSQAMAPWVQTWLVRRFCVAASGAIVRKHGIYLVATFGALNCFERCP